MIVYLHVGAPKTGTSYVQRFLRRNQGTLAENGLCYPGERKAHFWAAQDLRETYFKGWANPNVPGAWAQLVEQIRQWDGPAAIIDHENFGRATREQIDRALVDLDFAEVHVIYTVRDLARQLPAVWQESIKNGATITFTEFLESVRNPEEHNSRGRFWGSQDYAAVLARWSHRLPPERVHVITVPPPGNPQNLLWERIASVVGLDPSCYEQGDARVNASLGTAETAALRRLNLAAEGKNIEWPAYEGSVKGVLSHRVLAGRPGRQSLTLPADEYPWVQAHTSKMIQELKDAQYNVVGDLAELVPDWPADAVPAAASADSVPVEDQLEAAAEAMAGLVERISVLRRRAERAEKRLSRVRAERDRARARAKRLSTIVDERPRLSPAERVKRTVVELEGDVSTVRLGLGLFRRVRALARKAR